MCRSTTSDLAPKTRWRENAVALARTPAAAVSRLSKTSVASVADAHATIGWALGTGSESLCCARYDLATRTTFSGGVNLALFARKDRQPLPRIERGDALGATSSQMPVHLRRDLLSQLASHEVNPLWRCEVLPHLKPPLRTTRTACAEGRSYR